MRVMNQAMKSLRAKDNLRLVGSSMYFLYKFVILGVLELYSSPLPVAWDPWSSIPKTKIGKFAGGA
jgi:hypothetical protein